MKIRIVCQEDLYAWILGKFALRMKDCFEKKGFNVDISKNPDPSADVNHYIIYSDYRKENKTNFDSLMITHIDNLVKLKFIKENVDYFRVGVCMSRETMDWLVNNGVPKNKLCFIDPAHDGKVTIKKSIVGITCRVQSDGRKNEKYLSQLADVLDPRLFKFKIMGDSWEAQIEKLLKNGFEVEYYDHFILDKYYELISSLDYYLYMGMDEGQMGFLDAAAAGVKTIVTEQGYHIDAIGGISYPFVDYDGLLKAFSKIQGDRLSIINSVKYWTWNYYCDKHLQVWNYLLNGNIDESCYSYPDGLHSLLDDKTQSILTYKKNKGVLLYNTILQYYNKTKDKLLNQHNFRHSE